MATSFFPVFLKRLRAAAWLFRTSAVCLCWTLVRRGWAPDGHQGQPEAVGGAGHLNPDWSDPETHLCVGWRKKVSSSWKQGHFCVFNRGLNVVSGRRHSLLRILEEAKTT